jgi:hypothetical protein
MPTRKLTPIQALERLLTRLEKRIATRVQIEAGVRNPRPSRLIIIFFFSVQSLFQIFQTTSDCNCHKTYKAKSAVPNGWPG